MINLQASVQKALTVPVRGRVQIQGYTGSYNGRTVEVVLRPQRRWQFRLRLPQAR
jgi:hypothetical protein